MDISPSNWQHWGYASLALFAAMAIDTDLRQRRITNLQVLLMLGTAVALHALGPANGRGGLFGYFPGALGVAPALLGALVGLLMFLPLYALRAMGAGDVKFMAALGAFSGPAEAVGLGLAVLVAGGMLALLFTLSKHKAGLVLRNLQHVAAGWAGRTRPGFDPATQTALTMPYALAFALGLLGYGWWRHGGHAPLLGI